VRVALLAPDSSLLDGCTHYRLLEPARCSGLQWTLTAYLGLYPDGRPAPIEADVLVMQRPVRRRIVEAIPYLQAQGTAVVVDIDDDLESVAPEHPAFTALRSADCNPQWLRKAAAAADLVTVTTPRLAQRYPGSVLLPNFVSRRLLALKPTNEPVVGWLGALATAHPRDLEATRGGVAQALRESHWRFLVTAQGPEVARRLELDPRVVSETGPLAPRDFERTLSRVAIGIAPLDLSAFNEAKSALKGLQYAAAGVPFLASPTGPYKTLASEGAGILVPPRTRSWRGALLELMRSEARCEELSQAGRELISERHLIEKNGWRYAEAWAEAAARRAKGVSHAKAA
jgi:glycosyltransferase involved in cell wall biosynthesis